MIILGVDQGLANIGFAIVKDENGELSLLEHGCFTTKPKDELSVRLEKIYQKIKHILRLFNEVHDVKIDGIAMEELFVGCNKNEGLYHRSTSIVTTSMVTGVITLLGQQEGISTYRYTPTTVKKNVCNDGRAKKEDVAESIYKMFKTTHFKYDHECDATAIACTCLIKNRKEV